MRASLDSLVPYRACSQFHDSQPTTSMVDMLHSFQQNDPTYPIVSQHHYTGTYQHMKGLQQIEQFVLHSSCSGQEWKES